MQCTALAGETEEGKAQQGKARPASGLGIDNAPDSWTAPIACSFKTAPGDDAHCVDTSKARLQIEAVSQPLEFLSSLGGQCTFFKRQVIR